MSGHAGIMHRSCMFMWRKLNGTGGAPGAADAVTYTLVWAGGKRKSAVAGGCVLNSRSLGRLLKRLASAGSSDPLMLSANRTLAACATPDAQASGPKAALPRVPL